MRKETIQVRNTYGPLQIHTEYAVIDEGYDYVKVRCCGKAVNVPNYLIGKAPVPKPWEQDIEEEEMYG